LAADFAGRAHGVPTYPLLEFRSPAFKGMKKKEKGKSNGHKGERKGEKRGRGEEKKGEGRRGNGSGDGHEERGEIRFTFLAKPLYTTFYYCSSVTATGRRDVESHSGPG